MMILTFNVVKRRSPHSCTDSLCMPIHEAILYGLTVHV